MPIILLLILIFSCPVKHSGDKDFVPPGTVKVNNLFVARSEVSNAEYLEFLFYQKQALDSIEYYQLLPDTANFWYNDREYQYFPIVHISYEQAVTFCQWKSQMISEKYKQPVIYRLPTPEEWEMIAEHLINSRKNEILQELKKTVRMIHRNPDDYVIKQVSDKRDQVNQLFDNVSEMTSKRGIALGGNNYYLTDLRSNLNRVMEYSKPNAYIGFRFVAEIE